MRCLLSILALALIVGCRAQSTAMTNPFLAPNRVPPPATRSPLPGTAQPYYQGDPLPNAPVIGTPPGGFAPAAQPTQTFAPQPAGVVPPGGWNSTPQAIPPGSSSYNVPSRTIQPASANIPLANQPAVQIQPDQQSLRFADVAPSLPPDPSILPTPQQAVSPYPNQLAPNQLATFESAVPSPQFVQQSVPTGQQREVRIRAIPSDNLATDGTSRARDGFRPQGSSRVRKPALIDRLAPRKRGPTLEESNRYGFDPQYAWLRGQLLFHSAAGQWGLRYAPGRADADQFGGDLIIANPQVLGNLQPGDFVQLRGRVEQSPQDGNSLLPVYNVTVVQRQRI